MSAPPPAEALPARVVREALAAQTEPGDGIVLAVSGGSDSVGMLRLVSRAAPALELRLVAGFVDHGLREGVEQERQLVEEQARKLAVPFRCLRVEPPAVKPSGSVQAWAREERYRLLEALARELGFEKIATGHTRDDQAETILIRLLRGTGLDGLRGIPKSATRRSGLRVVRPVLELTRDEIRAFLRRQEIPYADDPSNDNPRFLRVRVRKELLPLMDELHGGVRDRLAALADDVTHAVEFLDRECLEASSPVEYLQLAGGVRISAATFSRFPRGIWPRLIRLALKSAQGDLRRFERAHIEPIVELIAEGKSTDALALPGSSTAYVDRGSLFVFPEPLREPADKPVAPRQTGPVSWYLEAPELGVGVRIEADSPAAADGLSLRPRRLGDRLFDSSRKLKDLVEWTRIPRPYRRFVPVLAFDNQIISCPRLVECRKNGMEVAWAVGPGSPLRDIALGHDRS